MFNFFKSKKPKILYRDGDNFILYLKCDSCGEVFRSYLRRGSDFSVDYSGNSLFLKKEYIGTKCYKKIQFEATLNYNYKILSHTVTGGKVITKEEWENASSK